MSKLFQVYEQDLETLERDLPAFLSRHMICLTNADRAAVRRMQEVITNVRWNYGPPTEVESMPADDFGPEPVT